MIIWQGKGYLVAIILFLSSLFMEYISETISGNDQLFEESPYYILLAFLMAGLITRLVYAKFLYKENESNGEIGFKVEPVHTLFFIPFKYWSLILYGIGVAIAISRVIDKF